MPTPKFSVFRRARLAPAKMSVEFTEPLSSAKQLQELRSRSSVVRTVEKLAIARPGIVSGCRVARLPGVLMDVADNGGKLGIRLDGNALVSALEEMSHASVSLVEVHRIR